MDVQSLQPPNGLHYHHHHQKQILTTVLIIFFLSLDVLGRPLSSASQWADTSSLGRRSTFRTSTPTALLIDAVTIEVPGPFSHDTRFLLPLSTVYCLPLFSHPSPKICPHCPYFHQDSPFSFIPFSSSFFLSTKQSPPQTLFLCPFLSSVSISLQNPLEGDQSRGIIVRSRPLVRNSTCYNMHMLCDVCMYYTESRGIIVRSRPYILGRK